MVFKKLATGDDFVVQFGMCTFSFKKSTGYSFRICMMSPGRFREGEHSFSAEDSRRGRKEHASHREQKKAN